MIIAKKLTETSPGSNVSQAGTATVGGLEVFDRITLVAEILGATGGALEVVVQTSYEDAPSAKWHDVVHFPSIAAGGALVTYGVEFKDAPATAAPLVLTSNGSLPVNTRVLGLPLGKRVRLFYIAGAGTTLGASQNLYAYGQRFS